MEDLLSGQITYNTADFPPGLVAVPATDWVWTESAGSLIQLRGALPPGSALAIHAMVSTPAANRNRLIEQFLKYPDFQWILFLDSDMTPEPHTAVQLLSHNLDVVSALTFMRHPPHQGCWADLDAANGVDLSRGGVQQVEATGAACLMVKRGVIERLSFPWFDSPMPGLGEDVLFCKKLRDVGYKIFLDTELSVGHMQARAVGKEEALQFIMTPRGAAMIAGQEQLQQGDLATQRLRTALAQPFRSAQVAFDDNGVKVEQPAAAR